MKPKLRITLLLAVMIGLPAFLAWNFVIGPILTWRDQYTQLLGKSEDQALAALGPPSYVVTAEDARLKGIDYPWRKMNYQPVPERQVTNKAFLYVDRAYRYRACYIFIRKDGRIEAIDFAGT